MKDRLKEFMKTEGLNARGLSERMNVQASSVSHILTGRNKPSIDFLEKLHKAFPEADLGYMITGSKQVESRETSSTIDRVIELGNDTSKLESKEEDQEIVTNVTSNSDVSEIVVFFKDGTFERYLKKLS